MMDFTKGLIVGIIAIKIFESNTVQSYIQEKIRQKGAQVGRDIAKEMLNPEKEKKEDIPRPKYSSYEKQSTTYKDKAKYPETFYDKDGNPFEIYLRRV